MFPESMKGRKDKLSKNFHLVIWEAIDDTVTLFYKTASNSYNHLKYLHVVFKFYIQAL